MTRVITDAEAAEALAAEWPEQRPVSDGDLIGDRNIAAVIRQLVSERDALAVRARELEAALWGCIAAIERTHHCTEADRLASADKARAALASKEQP